MEVNNLAQRVATLEANVNHISEDNSEMRSDIADIKKDLRTLLDAALIGRGAWWATVKIGGWAIGALTVVVWIWDHTGEVIKKLIATGMK